MSDLMPALDEFVGADGPLSVLVTTSASLTRTVRAIDPNTCVLNPALIPELYSPDGVTGTCGLLLRPLYGTPRSLTTTGQLLITEDMDDAGVWARAVTLHAHHVVCLPDGLVWLTDTVDTHLYT